MMLDASGASGQITRVEIRRLAIGRGSAFAVGATSVVAGRTDRFELHRFDAAGGPTTIIRVNVPITLLDGEGALIAR